MRAYARPTTLQPQFARFSRRGREMTGPWRELIGRAGRPVCRTPNASAATSAPDRAADAEIDRRRSRRGSVADPPRTTDDDSAKRRRPAKRSR
jgi:hypothetical protein